MTIPTCQSTPDICEATLIRSYSIQIRGVNNMTPSKRFDDDSIMPFGSYRGERLGDIPDDYWIWFRKQSWAKKWPSLIEYANLCVEDDE